MFAVSDGVGHGQSRPTDETLIREALVFVLRNRI